MSGVGFYMTTGEVSLVAATAKTVIEITAAANHRALLKIIGIFFKGTTVANEPVTVEMIRITTTGTGSAGTEQKRDPDMSEAIQTSFKYDMSAEPTGIAVLKTWYIHPQSGYEIVLPFDSPQPVPGSNLIGIRCTADDIVIVGVNVEGDE